MVSLLMAAGLPAQVTETAVRSVVQQLEANAENNPDVEKQDDSYLLQLEHFIRHPLNLNEASAADLQELQFLKPIQVEALLRYRQVLGKFTDLYELQAVPYWDTGTLEKIRPYIYVSSAVEERGNWTTRFRKGELVLWIRASQVLERSAGYRKPDSAGSGYYMGSPQKLLLRYQYTFGHSLQYGLLAEKDAGEQFFRGAQRQGFDFYSAHFYIRLTGVVKALLLGDYTVNMGQGLLQWQGFALQKEAGVMQVKREGTVLHPYSGTGETNFHRGIGISMEKGRWQSNLFASFRKIDGNRVIDSGVLHSAHISAMQLSGYHRTAAEVADKGIEQQMALGASLGYHAPRFQVTVNGVLYRFSLPLEKQPLPYNLFALSGRRFGNGSIDYSYTWQNIHFFGEAAVDAHFNKGLLQGMLICVSAFADLSFLYRNISPGYQSLNTSAFTQSTAPVNEKGFYSGLVVRPARGWQLEAYADLYRYPWLKYRVDEPSVGRSYFIQLSYQLNKQTELYSRFMSSANAINTIPEGQILTAVVPQARKDWRTQVNSNINPAISMRCRVEMVWFNAGEMGVSRGFLTALEWLYKPPLKRFSGNFGLMYFETDDYNSRIYAFESDILNSFSVSVFDEKGYRYYINLHYDINKRISAWIKWGQTLYPGKSLIGSGLDEIGTYHRSELKLQVRYKF